MSKTVKQVQDFWESNPLWMGESTHELGTKSFFEEQLKTVIEDGFAGSLDERILPKNIKKGPVLDLGCGPGLWTTIFGQQGYQNIVAVDLTYSGLILAQKRCKIYDVSATYSQQNAEMLAFRDGTFSHVNCQGVIHHTPDTHGCIREIARILDEDGTASISVYYRNILLRAWPLLAWPRKLLAKLGAGLLGRGREHIYILDDVDEVVRIFDGKDNPIGKSYTRQQFIQLLMPFFEIQDTYLHFFPVRTLPFTLPKFIHRWLDRNMGFLIYAQVKKKSNGSRT